MVHDQVDRQKEKKGEESEGRWWLRVQHAAATKERRIARETKTREEAMTSVDAVLVRIDFRMEARDPPVRDAAPESDELDQEHFDIRRSARYHDRRLTHYERLHRATNIVTVMIAGVVMMDFLGAEVPSSLKFLSFAGALLAACDLVIGFSRNANLHRNLKRSFVLLEKQLTEETVSVKQLKSRRLDIESEEPAIYRALDVLCYIETCAALGRDAEAHVPWYMRVTSQWLHWPDAGSVAIKSYQRLKAKNAAKAARHEPPR